MRIHTNLTYDEINRIPVTPGVAMHACTEHGSRTHPRAFEVILSGNSVFRGQYGDCDFKTATWDEWGVYLGRLFGLDPNARVGNSAKCPTYRNADHFHAVTCERYEPTMLPERLCPRHRWVYDGGWTRTCVKCEAVLDLAEMRSAS